MKKIYRLGNYVMVIFDGTNERLYPIDKSQLSEFVDHFLIENRDSNGPKDTQVSFVNIGTWFQEDGTTAWTVESLRTFFAGLATAADIDSVGDAIHGYYNIKSVSQTILLEEDEDIFTDVVIVADTTVDERPKAMVDAQAVAFDATTYDFKLEGLTTDSFGSIVADFSFDPDEDEGELSMQLVIANNTGSNEVSTLVEAQVGNMTQGADDVYQFQPQINFPIDADISTIGVGDAGKAKLQIKSTVAGTLTLKSVTWYLYK